MKRLFMLAVLLCLIGGPARALLPESGFYWDPAVPGTGYAIEFQDDYMFLTAYTYGAAGTAVFYTIQGLLDVRSGIVTGSLILSDGGTCIGCPFSPPRNIAVAPAEVRFVNNRSGVIRVFLPEGVAQMPITRFVYFLTDGSPNGELLGAWSVMAFVPGLPAGDALYFLEKSSAPAGGEFGLAGLRIDSDRPLVGARLIGTNTWMILLDSTQATWRRWIFSAPTPNRWIGLQTIYEKDGPIPPSSAGVSAIAFRITGRRTIDQIVRAAEPADPKAAADARLRIDLEMIELMRANAAKQRLEIEADTRFAEILAIDPELLETTTRALERQLLGAGGQRRD
jgi:hypothetical protein